MLLQLETRRLWRQISSMSLSHTHAAGHSHAYTAKTEKKPHSLATITVEVPEETLLSHRAFALESLKKNIKLDGFRQGHVPEKIIVEKLGEMAILTEAAEITISHLYPHILEDEKLDPIGSPKVTITKLAAGNPLHFTLEVSLIPEVILPDYLALAKDENKKRESVEITAKDVDEAIERVLRQKVAYDRIQEKARKRAEATDSGLTLPTPETAEEPEEDYSKLPLPELTDDLAKTLGNFSSIAEFREQLTAHLTKEKTEETYSKHRAALTDAIIDKTTIDLPEILTESELSQMFSEMEADITRAGLQMEDYLEHVKKTRDDLKKEWTPMAEKRAKLQLVLNEIARKEEVVPDQIAVEREISSLMERFKDADRERATIYVETVRNEAVMQKLESL